MPDRFVRRAIIWSLCTVIPAGAAAATVSPLAPSAIEGTAPLLAGAALLTAIVGWQRLHRELARMQHDRDASRETEQRQARQLHEAMHVSPDGQLLLRAIRNADGLLEDFEVTDVNSTGAALLRKPRAALVGKRLRLDVGGPLATALFARYQWAIMTGSPIVEEIRVDRRYLNASWLLHQAMPTSDGLAITARDISSRKREEKALRRASLTDDLTSLYNRRGFMAIAEQQLRVARRNGKSTVVMYADMDGFKSFNDSFGHATGDRALQAVARVLRDTVRDCDVVARLGGDEFTILACDADGTGARVIQRRIEERLQAMNASGELPAPLQLTIGYTRVRPTDHAGMSELLARADQLLYARKRRRQLTRTQSLDRLPVTALRPPAATTRVPASLRPFPVGLQGVGATTGVGPRPAA